MNDIYTSRRIADGLIEFHETIQSYTDPSDPKLLTDFLSGVRKEVINSPKFALSEPHYLALALYGQIKFTKECPKYHWLEDLALVTWSIMKPFVTAKKAGQEIIEVFENLAMMMLEEEAETLREAVLIIFLSEQNINVLSEEGENTDEE